MGMKATLPAIDTHSATLLLHDSGVCVGVAAAEISGFFKRSTYPCGLRRRLMMFQTYREDFDSP